VISGTPTTAGTTNFTVTATDSLGALCTDVCQVTVVPQPIKYYNIDIETYGGGDMNEPVGYSPANPYVSSGETICFNLVGRFLPGVPVWYRIRGNLGGPSGPPFDTGNVTGPPGTDPPGFVLVCWTAP
jgi:hypothetical protein